MGYGCKDSANRAKYQRKTVFLCIFPLKKYPLWCVSKSKNDMVPFERNPKSALSEQRSSDQQMGGEQQDECRPRGAEGVNGSVHVHFCFIYCLYLDYYK